MTTQPEALRLAERLESRNGNPSGFALGPICDDAAAELRRLHDLLGKANALCQIRLRKIEELEADNKALRADAKRDTDLLRQALWALESAPFMFPQCPQTIAALRERLGQ